MQFALLIYESPEAFASRKSDGTDTYTGAWCAYHKALVASGAFVAGGPNVAFEPVLVVSAMKANIDLVSCRFDERRHDRIIFGRVDRCAIKERKIVAYGP